MNFFTVILSQLNCQKLYSLLKCNSHNYDYSNVTKLYRYATLDFNLHNIKHDNFFNFQLDLQLMKFGDQALDMTDTDFGTPWFIHRSSANRGHYKYECCPEKYAVLSYRLVLKRRAGQSAAGRNNEEEYETCLRFHGTGASPVDSITTQYRL